MNIRQIGRGTVLWGWLMAMALPAAALSAEVDSYIHKAEDYAARQDYNAAIIELKNALQQEPNQANARYLLGEAYIEQGDGASAEKELIRALELGVAAEQVMPPLGRAYLMQGKYREALAEVKLDDSAPADARARVLVVRGDALLSQSSIEAAQTSYTAALALAPDLSGALLGMAKLAIISSNDTAKAKEYVEQVLARNADDVDALVLKGELFRHEGKPADALVAFTQANKLRPQNLQALLGKAMTEVAVQQYEPAAKDIEIILKVVPEHPIANYMQAVVFFQRKEYVAARDTLNKVLKVAPGHLQSQLLLGITSYQLGELEQAEYHLSRYVATVPNNVPGRKVLAAVYLKLNQPLQAIETLDVVSQDSNDAQLLALLGTAYLRNGDNEKGTENLQKAAELKPDMAAIRAQLALGKLVSGENEAAVSDLEMAIDLDHDMSMADMLLVYSHLRSGQFDKAIAAAQALAKKQPNNPVALNVLGVSYVYAGKRPEARAQFEKAIQQEPKFAAAYMSLARLALQDGNSDQARAYYQQLLKVDANNLGAMLALARLADVAGDKDTALQWIEDARQANPNAIEPALLLANAYLQKGEPTKALNLAREMDVSHPNHPFVLALLGRAQLVNDDPASAVATYKKLVEMRPKSMQAWLWLAESQVKAKQLENAVASIKQGLSLDEDFIPAQVLLARIYVELKRNDEAAQVASGLIEKHPDLPAGYEIQGNIYVAETKLEEAEHFYTQAFDKGMSSDLVMKLFRVRLALKMENAATPMESWLATKPDDTAVRLMLGMFYQDRGDNQKGIEHYQQLLSHEPDNIAALNNIAWLLQKEGDASALGYAEKAYKLAADNPAVVDTMGWLYVENGQLNRGLLLLQDARVKAPHIPDIAYHLAVALDKSGRREEARKELVRLLRDKPGFEHETQAHELLQRLQTEGD